MKPLPVTAGDHDGGMQISSSPRASGIKKRKGQAKKVVCIPAAAAATSSRPTGDVVPSDLWAWRKYGQKPIKGSPRQLEGDLSLTKRPWFVLSTLKNEEEELTSIRFLVPRILTGCIIGKGRSTIVEFQSLSGACIVVSRHHEIFPGTADRIVMVSGGIGEVMVAMKLICEKLAKEAEKYDDGYTRSKLRLIIPNTSCGWIIGKGGSTIKTVIADSHAGIRISSLDSVTGLKDRLVVVTGSLEERLDAMFLILSKLMEDVRYAHTAFYSFPFAAYNRMNYAQNDVGGRHPRNEGSSTVASKDQGNSVTIGISDDHTGLVIGHGGRNLSAISQASGAKIRVSERGDFIFGTSDRKVTITGSQKAIRVAEDMIMQKVSFVSESS